MLRLARDAFKTPVVSQSTMFEQLIKFFVVFFVVVEPLSIVPVFSGLTTGASERYRRRMALKAVVIAGAILIVFSLVGAPFLNVMGISIEAFRIFGGLLLFLIALEMVFARESGTRTSTDEQAESRRRSDISVFPLALVRTGLHHRAAALFRGSVIRRNARASDHTASHGRGRAFDARGRRDRRERGEPPVWCGTRRFGGAVCD
jgi:hypothetical protein